LKWTRGCLLEEIRARSFQRWSNESECEFCNLIWLTNWLRDYPPTRWQPGFEEVEEDGQSWGCLLEEEEIRARSSQQQKMRVNVNLTLWPTDWQETCQWDDDYPVLKKTKLFLERARLSKLRLLAGTNQSPESSAVNDNQLRVNVKIKWEWMWISSNSDWSTDWVRRDAVEMIRGSWREQELQEKRLLPEHEQVPLSSGLECHTCGMKG